MPRSASFVSRLQASVASFPVRTFLVTSTVLSAAVAAYLLVRRLRSQEKVSQPPTLSPASAPDSFSSSGGDSSKAHVNTCSSSGSSSTPPPPAGNGKQAEGLDQDGEEELAPASIFVYFGSQTGTAESYSEELASAILEEIDGVQKVPVIDLEVRAALLLLLWRTSGVSCVLSFLVILPTPMRAPPTCTHPPS